MSKPSSAVLSSQAAKPQTHSISAVLFMISTFLFWASLYVYVPILPAYAQSRTDNLALVGAVLSMYGFWQAVVRLPLGIVVDWLGHRKLFMLGGLLLAGLGAWVLVTADSATDLFIGRSITGLAAAAWAVFVVAFSGYYLMHETIQAAAVLTFVNSFGRIAATSLTGALTDRGGVVLPFYVGIGAAGLGLLIMAVTRQKHVAPAPFSVKAVAHVISRKDVVIPSALAALCQYVSWGTTYSFTPILAEQLGAGEVAQSLLLTGNLIAVIVGNLCAAILTQRLGIRRLTLMSLIVMGIGVVLTAISESLAFLFAIQCVLGLVMGLNLPMLMGLGIRKVDAPERNTAMGLHQSVYAIGMFAGPWLSGILASSIGLRSMLAATAAAVIAVGLPIVIACGRIFEDTPTSKDQATSM